MNQDELDKLPVHLVLTIKDINVIITHLSVGPFHQVADVIVKVKQAGIEAAQAATQAAAIAAAPQGEPN